jgi:hypothetical protein
MEGTMLGSEVEQAANKFFTNISMLDERLNPSVGKIRPDAGQFRDIFRQCHTDGPGAYWFVLPDQRVFYIGKCDGDVWTRICAHARARVWHGDGPGDYRNGTGKGWEFPNAKWLEKTVDPDLQAAIGQGEFHVGWATIQPAYAYFAMLLEIYLQTLCRSSPEGLPTLCTKIG